MHKIKILLLEDDITLNQTITKYLESIGHSIICFYNGSKALEAFNKEDFDFLILDINVPKLSGLELLERIQDMKKNTPTLYISALVDIEDISKAYSLGCYDYLKKPFHLKELKLRIDKILQYGFTPHENVRLSKNYSFNIKTCEVFFQRKAKTLTKKHFQVIELLARHRGRLVTYDMFRDFVWNDYYIDEGTIRAEINRCKKTLKEDFIKNVRGMGYMIEVPYD